MTEIERCHSQGARICKWLPNSMHINPGDEQCDPFYDACARLDIAILSHAGDEHSVELLATGAVNQRLGSPLLLRRALDKGVKVAV